MDLAVFNLNELLSRSFNDINELDLIRFINNIPMLGKGVWLAGGAIRRTLMGYKNVESDFDLFFETPEIKDDYIKSIENDGAILKRKNDLNACYEYKGFIIQCIHVKYYKDPMEILDSFDYTICQFATDGKTLYYNPLALYDLGRKRLVIHKVTYPVATLRRLLKYVSQGFYACSGCLFNLLESVARNPQLLDDKFLYLD